MRIRIEGRRPLRGTYHASGNSNAAIALIAASMLSDAPISLHNVPDTIGVGVMLEVGTALGLKVESPEVRDGQITLHTPNIIGRNVRREYADALGGTLLFLAPILARRRHAQVEIDYAVSRINTHLTALRDLGIVVHVEGGTLAFSANTWDKREIILTQTSVTATTICAILATALGKETLILNAASEPHVVDVLQLLAGIGAQIEGIGSNLLTVRGFGGADLPSQPVALTLSPDHVEIGSVAAMAALTGGKLTIQGGRQRDLRMISKVYARLGVTMQIDEDEIFVPRHERALTLSSRDEDVDASVESAPFPGFPSDLIGMATLIATQARGTVLVHEKLFANRLLFVDRLNSMGAQIVLCDPHRAIVVGNTPLRADYVDNPDVRIGLAMLGAALVADGETVIDAAEAFDRSFEHVLDKLSAIGAHIRRVEG